MNTFDNYISPFTWRYGTHEMRLIWSEKNKFLTWRKIWIALAKAQKKAGLVSAKEVSDLQKNEFNLNIERILEIENETDHDLFSAIKEFAENAKVGGGKIHLGATSMDIVDNADAIHVIQSLHIIEKRIKKLLQIFAKKTDEYADMTCMGFTHIQPAEPTTVGYRFAFYAQDLLEDYHLLQFAKKSCKAKGLKGAVGTAASYTQLLKTTKTTASDLEAILMKELNLTPALIATQVAPRKYDYFALMTLSSIASSLAKFAGDVRLLQSPPIGEWAEPFGKKQVGSSAMPFKRNPKNSEKICSLTRYIASLPNVALENATLSYLERTLDDSANKRIIMAEAFLALDEILKTAEKIIEGLNINKTKITYNLAQYGPFSASEAILMECVKKGADRQAMHEALREIALVAWESVQNGQPNPMSSLLKKNKTIQQFLSEKEIEQLMDVTTHVGDAPKRAKKLVKIIDTLLS